MFRRRPPPPPPPPAGPSPPSPFDVGPVLVAVASELFRAVAPDGRAEVHGDLAFDALQRVSELSGLTVDGWATVPPVELFERLNRLSTRLAELPPQHHVAGLHVDVVDGQVSTEITYRT